MKPILTGIAVAAALTMGSAKGALADDGSDNQDAAPVVASRDHGDGDHHGGGDHHDGDRHDGDGDHHDGDHHDGDGDHHDDDQEDESPD